MHPADIIASLRKRGYSQSRLAREMRSRSGRPMSHTAIGNVIYGRSRSQKIAARISRITGIPLNELFPRVYGKPTGRRS